jgi:hypothetical protein
MLLQPGGIRQRNIGATDLCCSKLQAAVNQKDAVPMFQGEQIHADLFNAPERENADQIVSGTDVCEHAASV